MFRALCRLGSMLVVMTTPVAGLTQDANASQLRGHLTILTPYPREMTRVFQRAFQQRHPAVKVLVMRKKTGGAVDHILRTAEHNKVDLFWASSPAPFLDLKQRQRLAPQPLGSLDMPRRLGSYPLHDPDGYFFGFAGSGFGMMWNIRYLQAKQLPVPKSWPELAAPVYAGHIGMSSPSRSGTTHVIVEAILQEYGWGPGWQIVRGIASNLQRVTRSSYAVPVGVRDGEFGIGLVIDYYALSAMARYYPVDFSYPPTATLLPASIAVVEGAPNPEAALAFIEFLLAPEGQQMLLDKNIRRLPVRPEVYRAVPADYPNPHRNQWLRDTLAFDVALSRQRYQMVNTLFDALVTDNLSELVAARAALQRLSAMHYSAPNQKPAEAIEEGDRLLNLLPVDAAQSVDKAFALQFDNPDERETYVNQWSAQANAAYRQAKEWADQALELSGAERGGEAK